jgi:hypothetical protein
MEKMSHCPLFRWIRSLFIRSSQVLGFLNLELRAEKSEREVVPCPLFRRLKVSLFTYYNMQKWKDRVVVPCLLILEFSWSPWFSQIYKISNPLGENCPIAHSSDKYAHSSPTPAQFVTQWSWVPWPRLSGGEERGIKSNRKVPCILIPEFSRLPWLSQI